MKRLCLLLLLLVPAIASGQKRVYLEKSNYKHNTFVIEEEGAPMVYMEFRDLIHSRDSVFFVISKNDCVALHDYFVELQKIYVKWDRLARKNKVKEYKKEIEATRPAIRLMWKTLRVPEWDWRPSASLPNHIRTSDYHTVFEIDEDGSTHIRIHFPLEEDYEAILSLGSKSAIDRYFVKLNWGRLMSQYQKLLPRKTEEDLNLIFTE